VRELLGRVKATVMGAVANADVPLEDAAEAAGLPPTAPLDAVHCVVHDEGFFKVEMEAEGLEARMPPPLGTPPSPTPFAAPTRWGSIFAAVCQHLGGGGGSRQTNSLPHRPLSPTRPVPGRQPYRVRSHSIMTGDRRQSGWTCSPRRL